MVCHPDAALGQHRRRRAAAYLSMRKRNLGHGVLRRRILQGSAVPQFASNASGRPGCPYHVRTRIRKHNDLRVLLILGVWNLMALTILDSFRIGWYLIYLIPFAIALVAAAASSWCTGLLRNHAYRMYERLGALTPVTAGALP